VVGDVCSVDVTSVTVGLVVLTDTVVGPWVDVVTSVPVVVFSVGCFITFLLLKGYMLEFRKLLKSDLNQAKSCSKSVNETDPFQLLLDFKFFSTF
jgi:hypothetical protein